MKEGSSAARGALALSIAGILSKVISVLYTPLLVHILGDSGYGVYSKVMDVFLFICYAVFFCLYKRNVTTPSNITTDAASVIQGFLTKPAMM